MKKMASLQRYTTLLSNIVTHLFIYILVSLALPTWNIRLKSAFVEAQLHDDPNMSSYHDGDGMDQSLTREYTLAQGSLRGLVVEPSRNGELQEVEVFLGIPYAAPPVGTLRFMPPGTALQWSGVKMATKFAAVCPQMLPDIKKESSPSVGRYNYIRRLLPFLKTQSEDCLYLNIYVPSQRSMSREKFPVLVFIHGESFEWNSGNPYDGTVLASYGKVMVITINYRLGILGFMKVSIAENTVGNFGLLDQVAALQWIKQNIEFLNGDPDSVTLMGHSTGAACVNYLMMSPVANGLFHRAILMSGSALSDWALASNWIQSTLHVVHSLNCPLTNNDVTDCLQKKRLSEIMNVKLLNEKYKTTFGPIIDGPVIPKEPAQVMSENKDLFSKYQLLYGVTQLESYHLLSPVALTYGMLEKERDAEIKEYTNTRFEHGPELAMAEILKLYTSSQASRQSHSASREVTLDVLGDARVSAPIVRTADYHSRANRRSYFYVFAHNSRAGEFTNINKSVHGEELAYIFGSPLGRSRTHFRTQYDADERLFSEAIMKQWTNFAKTGSPNAPVSTFMNLGEEQWNQYDLEWPEYDSVNQSFILLRIPPFISSQYRSRYIRFWNDALPEILKNFKKPTTNIETPTTMPVKNTANSKTSKDHPQRSLPKIVTQSHYPVSRGSDKEVYGRFNTYSAPSKPRYDDPYKQIKAIDNPIQRVPSGLLEDPIIKWDKPLTPNIKVESSSKDVNDKEAIPIKSSSATINIILAIGLIFLFINVVIFTALFYKKRRLKLRENELKRTTNCIHPDLTDDEENIYQKHNPNHSQDSTECNVLYILHLKTKQVTDDKYVHVKDKYHEACKTPKSDDSGGFGQRFKLRRHFSSSTLDAHTKVRDWITNEIVHRCSPMITRKQPTLPTVKSDPKKSKSKLEFAKKDVKKRGEHKSEEYLNVPKPNCQKGSLTGSLHGGTNSTASLGTVKIKKSNTILSEKTNSTSAHGSIGSIKTGEQKKNSRDKINKDIRPHNKDYKKVDKVSVAIDATSNARGSSVLKQKPAELSKSCDYCYYDDEKCNEIEKPLRRSQTMTEITQHENDNFMSAIKLQVNEEKVRTGGPETLQISHKHSISDPVENLKYNDIVLHIPCVPTNNIKDDIQPPAAFRNDINVTSKDESIAGIPLTAAESLAIIQRRNFPKVLPDLPHKPVALASMVQKRLSLPPQNNIIIIPSDNYLLKTGSLRPGKNMTRNPPLPPPRTTSTLDRRIQHQRSEPLIENSQDNIIFRKGHFRGSSFGTYVPSPTNRVNLLKLEEETYVGNERKLNYSDSHNKTTRPQPKVIISENEQITSEQKIIIKSDSGRSSPTISVTGVRVKLDIEDDLSSLGHESLVSASTSFNLNSDFDQSEEDLENADEASLLRELIGASDTDIDDMLPDTKGPATIFEKKHEIVKIKTNPSIPSSKIYDAISYAMPGTGPLEDFEKTAQIKQKFSLNKFQNRGETINSPLEKSHKIKEKCSKIPKTPIFTAKLKRDKTELKSPHLKLLKGNSDNNKTGLRRQTNFDMKENSTSDSSNDTESSTGTVKKVS